MSLYRRQSGAVSCPQSEIDVSIDWLYGMCAISSCEAGLFSREYANGTLVGAYSFSSSLEWMVQLLSWF